jgi:hypothetical protein
MWTLFQKNNFIYNKNIYAQFAFPNVKYQNFKEWLPITKHKKPSEGGKYFGRGEFWNPLMNTIMTYLNGRFKNPNHKF